MQLCVFLSNFDPTATTFERKLTELWQVSLPGNLSSSLVASPPCSTNFYDLPFYGFSFSQTLSTGVIGVRFAYRRCSSPSIWRYLREG